MAEDSSFCFLKDATAAHCDFSKTLPDAHHDRNRRGRKLSHPQESPGPPRPTRRKTFRPGCSRRRHSVQSRSRCCPHGSVRSARSIPARNRGLAWRPQVNSRPLAARRNCSGLLLGRGAMVRRSCHWRCRDQGSRRDRNPMRRSTTTSAPFQLRSAHFYPETRRFYYYEATNCPWRVCGKALALLRKRPSEKLLALKHASQQQTTCRPHKDPGHRRCRNRTSTHSCPLQRLPLPPLEPRQ